MALLVMCASATATTDYRGLRNAAAKPIHHDRTMRSSHVDVLQQDRRLEGDESSDSDEDSDSTDGDSDSTDGDSDSSDEDEITEPTDAATTPATTATAAAGSEETLNFVANEQTEQFKEDEAEKAALKAAGDAETAASAAAATATEAATTKATTTTEATTKATTTTTATTTTEAATTTTTTQATTATTSPPTASPTMKDTEEVEGRKPVPKDTDYSKPDDTDAIQEAEKEKEDAEEKEEKTEEELKKEEKVARGLGGLGFFLAILGMVFTAHQVAENPDGIFASVCRLAVTISSMVLKVVFMPCRKFIGASNPHYTGHIPVSTVDYSYRENYNGGGAAGFEMS